MKQLGKVLWFGGYNSQKGKENDYGFLEDSEGASYFIHKSAILEEVILREGDLVEFVAVSSKKRGNDTKEAVEVKVLLSAIEFLPSRNDKLIPYIEDWLESQPIEFLFRNLKELPSWIYTSEKLHKLISNSLLQLPIKQHYEYSYFIPEPIKEKMNLWYLLDGEKFNAHFSYYWDTSNATDSNLQEQYFERWLEHYRRNSYDKNWEIPVSSMFNNWIKKRYELNLAFPKNWRINSYTIKTGLVTQRLDNSNEDDFAKINVPISRVWKDLPPSFFKLVATKVKNKEVDLEIPFEAWALYLRDMKSNDYLISWIKNKWKDVSPQQRLTFFGLLGERWFHCYQLHTDLGSIEALLLWEDSLDLSIKGSWWNQLDVIGKCSWYVLAFRKEYKNPDFLNSDKTDPLLSSFQLLYKHYLGIEPLDSLKWHSIIQDYYITLAKSDDEHLLKNSTWLWPSCEYSKCTYCEGKPWPTKLKGFEKPNRAYCPRTKKECELASTEKQKGARFRNYDDLPTHWIQWKMPEILSFLQIVPPYENTNSSSYVTKFGGWLNRLIEIQERIKCRSCREPLVANFNYSKDFTANYSMTVATCNHATHDSYNRHDKEVYFNDCWNHNTCNKMIDSRDNPQRDMKDRSINPNLGTYRNYYLCIDCGAAKSPTYYPGYAYQPNIKIRWNFNNLHHHFNSWYYVPGDMCPKCGSEDMNRLTTVGGVQNSHAKCKQCAHTIRIPEVFLPVIDLWEQFKLTKN